MSLDAFFAKKSKKSKKCKINPMQLLEQITTDVPQPATIEIEKKIKDITSAPVDDCDDWDPIINDDVELDLASIRISDLSALEAEKEQAEADTLESANKFDESKVVWGGKTNEESEKTEPVEEEQPVKVSGVSAYKAPHLRECRSTNLQAQPNLESAEEFPSLDAAAQEKPKKVGPIDKPEVVDDSWTDVSKRPHKIEDTFKSSCTPHSFRNGPPDVQPKRFQGSYSQKLEDRYVDPSVESPRSQTSSWTRGDTLKGRATAPVVENSKPSWVRGTTISSDAHAKTSNFDGPKPYVIPSQRKIVDYTQANRFAQLDDAL